MSSVSVGSIVGFLDLDIGGFVQGLRDAAGEAASSIAKIERPFEKLAGAGKKLQDVGGDLTKYVSLPIAGAGAALLKFGSDFETEMTNIRAITGMSKDELKVLEDGIKEIASSTGLSQKELAFSAKMVAEAGGDMDMMLAQLKAGADLAVASQTDLGTTLDMVGSTMKTFGLEAEDARGVVDSLAYVTTLANTSLSDISSAYVNVGGQAKNAGLSIDEVNAILVELANAGLKGGAAGTALAGVLRNLSTPTEKAADELAALGVSLYDIEGNSRASFDIMEELGEALAELTDEQRARSESIIFDNVSLKAWSVINREGMESIRELTEELEGSVDAYDGIGQAAGMAGVQQEGLASIIKSIYPLLEEMGKVVLKAVKPALEFFIGLIKDMLKWFTELPQPIQTAVVIIAALAAALGPVLVAMGTAAALIPAIIAGVTTIVAAMTAIGGVLAAVGGAILALAAHIGIIIGIIAALGVAIYAIVYYWDDIKATASAFWNWFTTGWDQFGKDIATLAGAVWDWIKNAWSNLWNGVLDFAKSIWNMLPDEWKEILTDIYEIGEFIWNKISEAWNAFWERVFDGAKLLWGCITDAWESFTGFLQSVFTSFVEWITDKIDTFSGYISDAIDAIIDFFTPMMNAIGDAVEWVIDKITGFAQEMLETAIDIGTWVVEGIWKGISNAASWFYDKITGFFSNVTKSIKRLLRIGSPSKLFADEIGKWIPAGIAEGFEEALPAALQTIDDLLSTGIDQLDPAEIGAGYISQAGFGGGYSASDWGGDFTGGQVASGGGGNTFVFNSPEPITEAVATRLFDQQQRELAYGF